MAFYFGKRSKKELETVREEPRVVCERALGYRG